MKTQFTFPSLNPLKSAKVVAALLCGALVPGVLLSMAAQAQDSGGADTNAVSAAVQTNAPAPADTSVKTLAEGEMSPDFVSKDLEGKERRLSEWRDKVVVLDFWATWCGPCKASLPHTQEVAKRSKEEGVIVLAVCTSDTRAAFEKFVNANREKYPDIVFTCDPNERGSASFGDRASQKLYGVRGIPTQFVIGRDGKIAAVLVGYEQGEHRLEDALKKLGVKAAPADTAKSEK